MINKRKVKDCVIIKIIRDICCSCRYIYKTNAQFVLILHFFFSSFTLITTELFL